MGNKPAISSLDLSWLAEKADGTRDQDLALVKDAEGVPQIRVPSAPGGPPALEPGDEFIATVRTEGLYKREPVVEVTLRTASGGVTEVMQQGADALFWTDSSVEKFLYPYYHSQRIWNKDLDKLKKKFSNDPSAIAVLHRAPSTSQTLSAEHAVRVCRSREKLEWVGLTDYVVSPR